MTDGVRFVPIEQQIEAARERWLTGCVARLLDRFHADVARGKFVMQYSTSDLLAEPLPDVATRNEWTRRVAAAVRTDAGKQLAVTEVRDHKISCDQYLHGDAPRPCDCLVAHLRFTLSLPPAY